MIHSDAHFAGLSHWNLCQDIAFAHGFTTAISVIATVRQHDTGLRQVIDHHQIKAQIIRRLSGYYLGSHGEPVGIDAEVDLGREPTS